MHAKSPDTVNLACITRNFTQSGLERLVIRPEEKVVGRVGHELSLTHGAGGGRNRSAVGVQALDEGGVEQFSDSRRHSLGWLQCRSGARL